MMMPPGRPRIIHLRRGDAPLTWCGRHAQRVLWSFRAANVTCRHCRSAFVDAALFNDYKTPEERK